MRLPDYLEGAVDLHVHSAPDLDPRRYDDIDLAREAARAGMGGIVIKSHLSSTVERASLVSKIVPDILVYGGLVLNSTVGGFNPDAVDVALRLGARQIWMPTRSAANHRRHHGQGAGGLSVLDAEGGVLPVVCQILRLIARAGCILGTGHLAPEEVVALIDAARSEGVVHILITHPEWPVTFYPVELQRRLSAIDGVYFERCFVSMTARCGNTPVATIADAIGDVGIRSTVISTDLGQPDTPAPVDGFRMYAERLRASGFSVDQVRVMMQSNPRKLLGIGAGRSCAAAPPQFGT